MGKEHFITRMVYLPHMNASISQEARSEVEEVHFMPIHYGMRLLMVEHGASDFARF
jgi:hypothetical protein